MAADDVARALLAMDDDATRAAVAGGDYGGIDVEGLDDTELRMVRAAALDDADVSGFIQCDRFIGCNGFAGKSAFGVALLYSKASQIPGFQTFLQAKTAQGATW